MRTTNKSREPKSRRNYGAKRASETRKRIKWKVKREGERERTGNR